jgi:hypothetical protein
MEVRFRLTRKRVTMLVVVAGLASAGLAYATIPDGSQVYRACMLNKLGTVRLIDSSLPSSNLMSHCSNTLETEVSWNQQGQPGPQGLRGEPGKDGAPGRDGTDGAHGTDGTSVVSAVEPPGSNCAAGGSKLTAANGVTYACNGAAGGGGGVTGHEVVEAFGASQYVGGFVYVGGSAIATCPAGKIATGGSSDGVASRPEGDNAWSGIGATTIDANGQHQGRSVYVWVVCANG